MIELCNIIRSLGVPQHDGSYAIRFGDLFEFYTRISNKVITNTFLSAHINVLLCSSVTVMLQRASFAHEHIFMVSPLNVPRVGSRVVIIDPLLHFMAGCHKRRLNQVKVSSVCRIS